MADCLVGVIGASGAVGRIVTRRLAAVGGRTVRIGSRSSAAWNELSSELGGRVEGRCVDVRDSDSLARFCDGCRVVVNCAGPSLKLLDLALLGALASGADYVDPGGDQPLADRVDGAALARSGRVALIASGMMPGLSALLVRWLALKPFDRLSRLSAYVGGRDRLSPAGAVDYILSLGYARGESLSIWRNGSRARGTPVSVAEQDVPFFPASAVCYPYLSAEAERVARALSIPEVLWYNVFEGGHMSTAFRRLQGAMAGLTDAAEAAAELAQAAELDLFGLSSYQLFHLLIEGTSNEGPFCRSLLVRGASAHELTGCTAAIAAEMVLEGAMEPGLHFAGEALPLQAIGRLREDGAVKVFQVTESDSTGAELLERGEL